MQAQDFALILFIAFFLLLVATVSVHLWMRTPYGGTSPFVAESMIRAAELRPGMKVFDLGAGDGRLLIRASRVCSGIRARGCELAPLLYLVGRLRIALSGSPVELRFGNAFSEDLRDADVVFLYLFPGLLGALSPKLRAELRPGTRVISHRFRIPQWEASEVLRIPLRSGERTVYVYRV